MKKLTVLTIIIASVFMIAPVFGQVYPQGMVSYWKFDEGSGTIATDSVGTNDGTLVNGPVWTSGQVNGALSFDGVNDYVEVPDDPSLRGMPELTLEVWICPVTLYKTYQGIIVKRNHYYPGTLVSYVLYMQYGAGFPKPGSFMHVINDNGTGKQAICTDNVPSPNQWSHLVGIYTGETIKVYLNGTSCGEEPFIGGNINNALLRLIIGAFAFDGGQRGYFNGLIDEVAIYNRALTPEEIQQHYQNGLNGLGYEGYITTVDIDIKPGSCPNPLNVESLGVLPVAILGSEDFDVNTIDIASIRLEGVAPIRSSLEDVAAPVSDANDCNCTTDGPDGFLDLTLKFKTQEVVEELVNSQGELVDGEVLALTLTGVLSDETPIEGADCVLVLGKVPKPIAAKRSDINGDGIVNIIDLGMIAEYWLESTVLDE